MRSALFVPGDDARKIDKGLRSEADALILDLEDSVALSRKAYARDLVRETVLAQRAQALRPSAGLGVGEAAGEKDARLPALIVRVNALDSGLLEDDLAGIMPAGPARLMQPKCVGGRDVQHLGARLAVHEAEAGLEDGTTQLIAIVTETPAALFALGTLAGASRRLCALTWGGEDLAAALGAQTNRDAAGAYTAPYMLARSLALFAAGAAEITAIDSVYTDFRDEAGLKAETLAARRDGFWGKMAIHPAQVPVINSVFTPDAATLAHARAIVAAFAHAPEAGVLSLEGKMIDRPHLIQAQRVLARAGQL